MQKRNCASTLVWRFHVHTITHMALFRNRYRIESARMRGHDYGNGWYFITICTRERICHFGTIHNGFMCLSDIGSIIVNEWTKTPVIRPYVQLDKWIVMPNHIHGVIHITQNGTQPVIVEPPRRGGSTATKPSWYPGCLGSIINQFKTACTKRIHAAGHSDFHWQPRFHDVIIRNAISLDRIRRYIMDNPATWTRDRNNPQRDIRCSTMHSSIE